MSRLLFYFDQGHAAAPVVQPTAPQLPNALSYVNPPRFGPLDQGEFNGHGRRVWVSRASLPGGK